MPEQKDKFYQFADLSKYSLKERITIRLIDWVCYIAMSLIGMTVRFEVEGWHYYESIIAKETLPIWTFWHDRIFLSTIYFRDRGILAITSKSSDGEYLARLIQRFGFGTVRGSSSRGGAKALIEMRNAMNKGTETAFTVDGPKGPRYEAKPGPVYLAKLTGNPILPFIIEPQKYWTLNSWDKLQIPRPFTRALLIVAEPISVNPDTDDTELEIKVAQMQRSLNDIVERGRALTNG